MKKNNHYTLMFFPEEKGRSFTLRIHWYTLFSLLLFLALFVTCLGILLYKTGEIALKLQLVYSLKEENADLKKQVRDLQIASEKIENIENITAYLYKLSNIADIEKLEPERPKLALSEKNQPVIDMNTNRVESRNIPKLINAEQYVASIPNIQPVDGWVTKHFLDDTSMADEHLGMDFAAAAGTPIRATAMGIVEDVRKDAYFGLMVTIRHDYGFLTRYGHCSQVLVSARDKVNRGQTVALVGNTGRSTAPHLHYEVIKDGKNMDPANFIGGHKH